MTTSLDKPIRRSTTIMGREYILTFNKLGVIYREKGSRDAGVLFEWQKGLLSAKGFNPSHFKKDIKVTKSGKTIVKRGLLS